MRQFLTWTRDWNETYNIENSVHSRHLENEIERLSKQDKVKDQKMASLKNDLNETRRDLDKANSRISELEKINFISTELSLIEHIRYFKINVKSQMFINYMASIRNDSSNFAIK